MTAHFVKEGEMTLDELRNKLVKSGWHIYKSGFVHGVDWYACRRMDSKRHCANNSKPVQIVVKPYRFTIEDRSWESVEIELRGAYPDENTWWDLKAYSLTAREAWENWEDIGMGLQKAWEAL